MLYPGEKELRRIRKRVYRDLTKKEQARIREVVEQTICLLRAMACGQGDASIQVSDGGSGGGWQWGRWTCDWLRDGVTGKSGSLYSPEDFRDSLMEMLAKDQWQIAKLLLGGLARGDWHRR